MQFGSTTDLGKNNIYGILMMLAKCLVLSIISVIISKISKNIHVFEIFFIAMIVRTISMLPIINRLSSLERKMQDGKSYAFRVLATTSSLVMWFYVLKITPINQATAISYTATLFTALAAGIIFKEDMNYKVWISLLFGFIGVLVILRPGLVEVKLGEMMALLTAFLWAASDIVSRTQARQENIWTQTFYNSLFMALCSMPFALYYWSWPEGLEWAWMVLIGLLFTVNHVTLSLSYRFADLIVVMPFSFSRLLFTAMLAYFISADPLDRYEFIGSLMILLSNLYIIYLEKKTHKAI